MGLTRGRVTLMASLLCLGAPGMGGSAQAASEPAELFGRAYFSTAVKKDGAPHRLFEGTEIRVDFERREEYDVVRWRADCNYFGAPVEITDKCLVTGQAEGTLVACSPPLARQDGWLARFFASNPRWRTGRGQTLRLRAGERVVKLRRRAADR